MRSFNKQTNVSRTIILLEDDLITLTDVPGVGQYGSLLLKTFPAAEAVNIHSVGFKGSILLLAPFVNAAEGQFGIGFAAAPDATPANATLEVLDPVDWTAAAKLAPLKGIVATGHNKANPASLYLNVWVDDNAAHATTAGNKLNGRVTLLWSKAGDQS